MTELAGHAELLTAVAALPGVVGVGIDVVDIERMRVALDRTAHFDERVFTAAEIGHCRRGTDPAASFSARFAAKEAVLKSLGVGLWEVPLLDIEVGSDDKGAPSLAVTGRGQGVAADRGVDRWLVSLSHDGGIASAVVLALSN